MASHSVLPAKGIRTVKACTQCKQMKLRCDAKEMYPHPCSRCSTKQLDCIVDAAFRRTPTRRRILDLTRKLQSYETQIQENNRQHSQDDSAEAVQTSPASLRESSSLRWDQTTFLSNEDAFANIQAATMESIEVPQPDIIVLFKLFSVHIYPRLPVISPNTTVSKIQTSSPLLFWTIIVITSQQHSSYVVLLRDLIGPFKDFLAKSTATTITSLSSVQAILYLCMWPLQVRSQFMDTSWQMCGLCISAAFYMGIHKPRSQQSLRSVGIPPNKDDDKLMTWLGCFVVGTSLSVYLGLPNPIRSAADLANIEQLSRDSMVPPRFAAHVRICHCSTKYLGLVSDNSNTIMTSSIKDLLDKDMASLREKFQDVWNADSEAALLTMKLLIYSAMVVQLAQQDFSLEDRNSDTSHPHWFFWKTLLSACLANSVSLITIVCRELLPDMTHAGSEEVLMGPRALYRNGVPKFYFRGLAFATFFIMKYFALNPSASADEQNLARSHVTMAHSTFTICAREPEDESARVAAVIEALSRSSLSSSGSTYKLRVTTRLGASILYDIVSTASEVRNWPVHFVTEEDPSSRTQNPDELEHAAKLQTNLGEPPSISDWIWNSEFPEGLWEDFSFGSVINVNEVYF